MDTNKETNLVLSWRDVEKYCNKIVEEVKKSEVVYDTVLCISRGGLIPGAMISYILGAVNVVSVSVQTRDGEEDTYNKPFIPYYANVLVVDDINDSGKTLELVKELLNDSDVKEEGDGIIEYCSLVKKEQSKFKKGIYGYNTDSLAWVVFPWDK